MAWIESHQALGQHPKVHQLATLLRVSLPAAVGHLHYLWWWALDFAPTGVIPNATPVVVARAAQWPGNPDKFWLAMVQAGWVDVDETRVSIHDWLDYAGRLVEKRAANAERMRIARAKTVQRTSGARAGATVPDRTGPNQTGPDPPVVPPNGEMHVQRTSNGTTHLEASCCTKFAQTGTEHLASCSSRR